MYPSPALSASHMAIIAIVPILSLAIWLIAVFVAARDPRRRDTGAGTVAPPQQLPETDVSQRKAA